MYVHFPLRTLSIPQPSMHSFCCKVVMRCEFLSNLCSFHKVRQGASGREIACHWFTGAPENAEVSLSYVQKWLSILMLTRIMWIVIYSVCEVINTRIQCIQNPEGADFWPQSAFLPHTNLLFIATYYEWQILWPLYPYSRKLSLESKGSLTQGGLLCFLDSETIS